MTIKHRGRLRDPDFSSQRDTRRARAQRRKPSLARRVACWQLYGCAGGAGEGYGPGVKVSRYVSLFSAT